MDEKSLKQKLAEYNHAETFAFSALVGENELLRKENGALLAKYEQLREDYRAVVSQLLEQKQCESAEA